MLRHATRVATRTKEEGSSTGEEDGWSEPGEIKGSG